MSNLSLSDFLYQYTDTDTEFVIVNEKLEILGDQSRYESKYVNCEVVKIHNNIKGIMAIEIKTKRVIEPLNAYKLMEAPYMADKLKEMNYDTFMEHLKQSEVEIANKINELIDEINSLKEKIDE